VSLGRARCGFRHVVASEEHLRPGSGATLGNPAPAPRRTRTHTAQARPGHDTLGFSCDAEASVTSSEVRVELDSSRQIIADFTNASRDKLVGRMGIAILEATAERVVGTMPVEGNTQPYGLLHGGASCVLAETLGSLGAALHSGPDRFTVGIEISATHHRAAAAGRVTGVATKLHGGRTVATYETVISDDRGRRVCTARLTCVISDRVPGSGRPMAAADALTSPAG
jgi:1,4-dihydroxy-2-naphthoyl-CoA hydrolase